MYYWSRPALESILVLWADCTWKSGILARYDFDRFPGSWYTAQFQNKNTTHIVYTAIVSMVLEFQREPSNRFRIDSLVQNFIARSRISNSTMHGSHLGNLALPCSSPTTTEPRRSCWGPLWHTHGYLLRQGRPDHDSKSSCSPPAPKMLIRIVPSGWGSQSAQLLRVLSDFISELHQ